MFGESNDLALLAKGHMNTINLRCAYVVVDLLLCVGVCLVLFGTACADTVEVRDAESLRRLLPTLESGTTLRLAPGEYPGRNAVSNVANLTIEATDPTAPPHFLGGNTAWHFSRCPGLKLRHLRISGQSHNGLNLDDGGRRDRPTVNVELEHLEIRDVGPRGNLDAIKCSGLQDLTIRDCMISGWGGQAIDLVGCQRVLITGCRFMGEEGYSQSSGPQCKGGSEEVVIEKCRFENAGQRPINVGGSTGLEYFRPPGAKYEARRITVRNNVFIGSPCACAFTGVDGAEFMGNKILFPERWVFRILQETTHEGFAPCRHVRIEDNSIVFRRSQVNTEINVGPNTAPETFQFIGNRWFAEDRPERSKPTLPTNEVNGTHGEDPRERR
jgi:hypothetical protein